MAERKRRAAPSPTRSEIMAAVKSRDTTPEKTVARLLRAHSLRYRRDVKRLPGRPDFILPDARVALFVHGCWWHGHDCKRGDRVPRTNRDYWEAKIARNVRRDRRVARELRAMGWSVYTIWECRLKTGKLPKRLLTRAQQRTT